MTSPSGTLNAFIDAAADRVARLLAELDRDARREREVREAAFRASMAEVEARLSSLRELELRLGERIAEVKDGAPGRDGIDGKDGLDGRDGIAPTATEVADLLREDVTTSAAEAARNIVDAWDRPKDGAPGRDGIDGKDGLDGRDGIDGKDGERGPPGERGFGLDDFDIDVIDEGRTMLLKFTRDDVLESYAISLPAGPAGADGKDGERGADGPMGRLPQVCAWEDRVYYQADVVIFDGGIFQARRDTGKAPTHEDWTCIVRAGKDGADGRSVDFRGTWDSQGLYTALDVVQMNGASFVARHDDPGPCPGAGWQLMASQGKRGKPGERGPSGVGLRGAPGEPLKSAEVSEDGVLRLVNGDGTVVECDLYPVLSKI